jgi:ABC-type sugar transport system ATPase subunit
MTEESRATTSRPAGGVSTDAVAGSVLEVDHVVKAFDGVVAVKDATLTVGRGEVVALVGDNGAGKSTLVKLISGIHAPDSGTVTMERQEVPSGSVAAARAAGIETVYQDLGLFGPFSIVDNIYMGREPTRGRWPFLDRKRMLRDAEELMRGLNEALVPVLKTPVAMLSGGQRQAVALARSAAWGSKLVILDEPTAALGVRETAKAVELIQNLRASGTSVLIVSHDLNQVLDIADRVTVMRLGRAVGTYPTSECTPQRLIALITGVETE